MQLCYRGVFYPRPNHTVETVETDSLATFLGQSYPLRRPIYQPISEKHTLIYRGVPYHTDRSTVAAAFPQIAPFMMGLTPKQSL